VIDSYRRFGVRGDAIVWYTRDNAGLHVYALLARPLHVPSTHTVVLVVVRVDGGDTAAVRVSGQRAGGIVRVADVQGRRFR